jgi:2-dehydropantoate 2-reductase
MAVTSSARSIAVVGAGGVGGLLAAMLTRGGNDVRVLARGAALAAVRDRGIRVRGPGEDYQVAIARASDDASELGPCDIVIVTVKTWQLAELAPRLAPLVGPHSLVIPMQNGVEASEQLAPALGDDRVLGGVAKVISWAEQPGDIRWITPPTLTIGARRPGQGGGDEAIEACATALRAGGIAIEVSQAIERARWGKFLFIAPYSAVGAVERAPLGAIRTDPRTRHRLVTAMREVADLAAARGVGLPIEALATTLQLIDSLPPDATTSMHRDIAEGRPSELDQLIGAVVRLGRASQVDTPVSAGLYAELAPLERKARGGRP